MNKSLQSQLAPFVETCRQQLTSAQGKAIAETKPGVPALDPSQQAILAEASRAIQSWQDSAEGQASLQALRGMSLAEVQQTLTELLRGPVFASTFELINKPSTPPPTPINSVSFGAKFEAVIVVGISGSIGVAIDPHNLKGVHSTFLSGGFDEGVDAGAFAGFEFGIWGNTPDNMGGFSFGGEITAVDGLGGSLQAFTGLTPESWGITLSVGGGGEDGGELLECYTLILGQGDLLLPPIYQHNAKYILTIDSLYCKKSNSGEDKVNFTFTIDNDVTYPYPTWDCRKMSNDGEGDKNESDDDKLKNTWNTGRSVKFNTQVDIQLYDDKDKMGAPIIFTSDDFNNTVGTQTTKTMNRPASIGNGWNQVTYDIHATLLAISPD